jgi:hypothetical protein
MLNVIMLTVIILNVVMLCVIMLSVVVSLERLERDQHSSLLLSQWMYKVL